MVGGIIPALTLRALSGQQCWNYFLWGVKKCAQTYVKKAKNLQKCAKSYTKDAWKEQKDAKTVSFFLPVSGEMV